MLEAALVLEGKLLVLVLLGSWRRPGWSRSRSLSRRRGPHCRESAGAGFLHDQEVLITLVLLVVLGAIFLKGFKEAIGVAVMIVGVYLLLNIVVVALSAIERVPGVIDWQAALFSNYGNPLLMIVASLLVFPRLALGLSGFETGVGMMPLVRGDPDDDPERPPAVSATRKRC